MFPRWNSPSGQRCLEEVEERYEKEYLPPKELFGPIFLFQLLRKNKEYYQILRALCLPISELPLCVNSEFESVRMIVQTRLKYNL